MKKYPELTDLHTLITQNQIIIDETVLNEIKSNMVHCETNTPILQFNQFSSRNIDNLLIRSKSTGITTSQTTQLAQMAIIMLNSIKVFTETKSEDSKAKCLQKLNEELGDALYSSSEIVTPYLNQLFDFDIKTGTYSNIEGFVSKYSQSSFKYLNEITSFPANDHKTLSNIDLLSCYYINPNAFIHFIELQIEMTNALNVPQNQLEIIQRVMVYIMGYYSFAMTYSLQHYNEIINTIMKGLIAYSIEIIVKNVSELSKESILSILQCYFQIAFELNVSSNEIYIFSLLSILILVTNFIDYGLMTMNHYLNSKIPNENLTYFWNIIKGTIKSTNLMTDDILHIILIKLIENILMKKRNKTLEDIKTLNSIVNLNDFIMSDFALYPKAYDLLNNSTKNFKEKLYWNFSEICTSVYVKSLNFPKVHKKTIMRYLSYEPDCKTLLYNLIQYYYANKNFRKTKILIQKVLSSISIANDNQIDFDIETIILFIQSHIYINERKYDEAKNLSILNLKRLEKTTNEAFLSKCYMFLGFTYSKLGDIAYNIDERNLNHSMALKFLEQSHKNPSNSIYSFYVAHQLFKVKKYDDCQKYLNHCDLSNIHLLQLKIVLHITMLEYDQALGLCRSIIRENQANIFDCHTIYLLQYYLMIYLQITYPNEDGEANLIQGMKEDIGKLYIAIVARIKKLSEEIGHPIESKRDNDPQKNIKSVIRFNTTDIKEKQFNASQRKLQVDLKLLETAKIAMIKNLYLLVDYMYENGLDNQCQIYNEIKTEIIGDDDASNGDINLLLISAIRSKFDKNDNENEMLLKKILEIEPTNMTTLKLFVMFLIKRKKDYSNAYVYCLKGIKMDDKEMNLWEYLSQYYLSLNDQTKYYECVMKEIENSKFHINSFLSDLIPKEIL